MYKILIVEDDQTIGAIIAENLQKWGYLPRRAMDFHDILALYTAFEPHLVLLDINLPHYDGFYWCGRIRQVSKVPILFLSSRDTEGDQIRAITQGGDDYIEKPFSMDFLIVKIQALLRRAYAYRDQGLDMLQYQELLLNMAQLKVFYGEQEAELTKNESKILALLLQNQGNLVTRTRMMKALWEDESFVDDNTLTVNVNRLRKKLAEIGLAELIVTIKGEGYRLK